MGKKKRVKRAYLKRYASDFINVLQGIDQAKLRTYHERVESVSGPKNNVSPIKNNTWTQKVPVSKIPPIGRLEAEIKILYNNWNGDRHQGFNTFSAYTTLVNGKHHKIRLFSSNNHFFFEEEKLGVIRRSKIYTGRQRAMWFYDNCRIEWLPPPPAG